VAKTHTGIQWQRHTREENEAGKQQQAMSSRTFQLLTQEVTGMARTGKAKDKYRTSHDKLCQNTSGMDLFSMFMYSGDLKKV
jgi:hypothetical protein